MKNVFYSWFTFTKTLANKRLPILDLIYSMNNFANKEYFIL